MLFLNRGFEQSRFRCRIGAGIVILHPESTVRGLDFGDSVDDFDTGYFLSGPALNLGINKRIKLTGRLYFDAETKATLAYSKTPIARGKADVYNVALHLMFGIGYDLLRKD